MMFSDYIVRYCFRRILIDKDEFWYFSDCFDSVSVKNCLNRLFFGEYQNISVDL
ncbi:hypothetical protein HanRHA438_Chr13g0583721 [Helianthus annuus]|nr:hypothetical protein HanRHA438_Chr13g0583721 [Helianthus annuus]